MCATACAGVAFGAGSVTVVTSVMIRAALVVAVLLALYYGILWVRSQEPEVRASVGKWGLGILAAALLAVPLIRLGLHWYAAAGSTALMVLRRGVPWALRAWPLARKILQRRRRGDEDEPDGA